jgi:hypothetical protein
VVSEAGVPAAAGGPGALAAVAGCDIATGQSRTINNQWTPTPGQPTLPLDETAPMATVSGAASCRAVVCLGALGMILAGQASAQTIVEGISRGQRLQELLDRMREVTSRALLDPIGESGREMLVAWGFPEPCLDRLDVGYFPDPAYVAWELERSGASVSEAEGAGLLEASWSGRVVGPWRNPRGRILTFFAWEPDHAERAERYVCARCRQPRTMFGKDVAMSPRTGHLCVVEGLLDVLLARCLGIACVVGLGSSLGGLSVQRLVRLAASGIREVAVVPPDDEAGRAGVVTVLENVGSPRCHDVEIFVVDPALMAGARDLGELVRRQGSEALRELHTWRMEGDIYRLVMMPWQD